MSWSAWPVWPAWAKVVSCGVAGSGRVISPISSASAGNARAAAESRNIGVPQNSLRVWLRPVRQDVRRALSIAPPPGRDSGQAMRLGIPGSMGTVRPARSLALKEYAIGRPIKTICPEPATPVKLDDAVQTPQHLKQAPAGAGWFELP